MSNRELQAIAELQSGKSISSVAQQLDLNKGYLSAVWKGYGLAKSEIVHSRSNYSYVRSLCFFIAGALLHTLVLIVIMLLKKKGVF